MPVVGLSAITLALRMLRLAQFHGSVAWSTDGMYPFGIMLHGHAAATELELVKRARQEARQAKKNWAFMGDHTPSRFGFPPNECAGVAAHMGRTGQRIPPGAVLLFRGVGRCSSTARRTPPLLTAGCNLLGQRDCSQGPYAGSAPTATSKRQRGCVRFHCFN